MEVTYCSSPVLAVREFNMANRILSENLLRNDKIDVHFNYSALECYKKYDREAFMSFDMFKHPFRISSSLWKETLRLHLSAHHFPKRFVETMNTDIVLMSCISNMYDYPFIKELLNSGHKVLVGGSNFRLYRDPEYVKNLLLMIGTEEKYLKNLIVVRGMVDLSTNLYEIIKKWDHHIITENDFSTVWDCDRDYLYRIKNVICNVVGLDMRSEKASKDFNNVTFLVNNGCPWGKCAFCGFHLQPKMDFDRGVDAEKIAQNIINTTKRLDTNRVYFSNDYFVFSKKMKKILELINSHDDYKINCYTGILFLQSDDYLKNINRYNLKYLKVGLESGTDFSLHKLNKGYDTKLVDETILKMSKVLDKDVEVSLHSIVDSPQRSRDEIIKNYDNLLRWRNQLRENGIKSNIVASTLSIIEQVNEKNMVDNTSIKQCEAKDSKSGRVKFINEIKKAFGEVINPRVYDHIIPFNRYDTDNNILPTDFEIIPEETLDELYGRNWGWS